MDRLIGMLGRIGALALVLAALSFLLPVQGEAAPMDHGAHHDAAMADHDDCGGCDESAPTGQSGHMGHGCHCVSAACTPMLPPSAIILKGQVATDVPLPPPSTDAKALALVDPPAKPPRT